MLWWLHMERGGMLLHDVVGINCKKGATTEYHIKAQVSSIWAKGCILIIVCVHVCVSVCVFVCVLSDLT